MVIPTYGTLTQKIGIISGVLLAVIFLILLCVFVIFAVCKKRRKRSRPPSSTGKQTADFCKQARGLVVLQQMKYKNVLFMTDLLHLACKILQD